MVWLPLAALFALGGLAVQQHRTRQTMRHVLHGARRLASGDLTHKVNTDLNGLPVELQCALSQLSVHLSTVIGDIHSETESLRGAVAEIASGKPHLSSRSEAQAGSLQRTASSMEPTTGTIQQTAASAVQGAQLAEDASGIAHSSHAAVMGGVQAMASISESARHIGEIIHVVEGVACQANMVALNAPALGGQLDCVSNALRPFRSRPGKPSIAETNAVALPARPVAARRR